MVKKKGYRKPERLITVLEPDELYGKEFHYNYGDGKNPSIGVSVDLVEGGTTETSFLSIDLRMLGEFFGDLEIIPGNSPVINDSNVVRITPRSLESTLVLARALRWLSDKLARYHNMYRLHTDSLSVDLHEPHGIQSEIKAVCSVKRGGKPKRGNKIEIVKFGK